MDKISPTSFHWRSATYSSLAEKLAKVFAPIPVVVGTKVLLDAVALAAATAVASAVLAPLDDTQEEAYEAAPDAP
jgi:hypothetical protein